MKSNYQIKIITTILLSMFFLSCSEKNESIELQPDKTKVYGDLDDFLIAEKPATLNFNDDYSTWTIKVPLKLIEPTDFEPNDQEYKVEVRLRDKNGDRIDGINDFQMRDRRSKENLTALGKFKSFLSKSKDKEIILELDSRYNKSQINDALKASIANLGQFRVRCDIYEKKNDKERETEFSENTDWNKVIDNYEQYFDEYIVFIKKANNGDMSAMEKYPELLNKAKKLEISLEKAKNESALTSSQISRLTKIQQKLVDATLEMQKNQ